MNVVTSAGARTIGPKWLCMTVPGTVFTLFVPLPAVGVIPYFITRWYLQPAFFGVEAVRWLGALMILIGFVVHAAALLTLGQHGCAPVPPVYRIVTSGVYRWARNPMYIGALLAMLGQAMLFGSRGMLIYTAVWFLVFHTFQVTFDEPVLTKQFGDEFTNYCGATPRWIPRPPRS